MRSKKRRNWPPLHEQTDLHLCHVAMFLFVFVCNSNPNDSPVACFSGVRLAISAVMNTKTQKRTSQESLARELDKLSEIEKSEIKLMETDRKRFRQQHRHLMQDSSPGHPSSSGAHATAVSCSSFLQHYLFIINHVCLYGKWLIRS
ncbi:hypothetical protein QAD02_016813 [Eretmocerus hayati]|uniref:Uncharacterized protein n=1 Tax=Eretmocerus hayati TaxID=131215 RepID=A0ACC2PDZ8_9HYME|nr:hypothetical protein QAD02_016813 [Eretmocerus hayati]